MVVAADFLRGTLPTWILLAFAIFFAWRITRGGGGSAVQELSAANAVLTRRKDELGAEVRDLREENATLKARTDVALALVPVLDAMNAHEDRAAARHTAQLHVLDMIAHRLGPDPNGGGNGH